MALIRVNDAAFPPAVRTLTPDVRAVCGYVGQAGFTPHVWTSSEVQAIRDSGRQWWAIWVPPQDAMSSATGTAAADGMLAALPQYAFGKSTPVFYDVERNSWDASSSGALAAISAWKSRMQVAGYTRTYAYVPWIAGFDWVAFYTGAQPTSLPAGTVGWQYADPAINGDSWDYSVFDSSLLGAAPIPKPFWGDFMALNYWFSIVRHDPTGHIYLVNHADHNYTLIPSPAYIDQVRSDKADAGFPVRGGLVRTDDMGRYGVDATDA